MVLRFTSLLILLALPAIAWADAGEQAAPSTGQVEDRVPLEAKLTQTVNPSDTIKVGESVTMRLAIEHPAGATVEFPSAFEPARWTLVDATQVPADAAERQAASTWDLTFGIYRPGETTLAPFPVRVTAGGETVELETEPVAIKAVSTLGDSEPKFNDPRPPVPVWVDDYTLAWLGGGFGLLALFGLLGWWVQRQKALAPPPPPPPKKPHEIALEKLSALAADDLVERGEYMVFWVRLSEAIREYLGRTYGFPPTELTTTEVLDNLLDVTWPSGLGLTDVRRFLRRCDEVKFGGAVPTVEESSEMLRRGFSIVELTRPRPEPQPQAGAATAALVESGAESDETDSASEDDVDARWKPPEDASKDAAPLDSEDAVDPALEEEE